MRDIPVGTKIGMPNTDIATGFKGYVWKIQTADSEGVTTYEGKVTGELTAAGEVEVVILGVQGASDE